MGDIMKHKRILMVVFFLSLFVFQQAQAGIGVPSNIKNNLPQPILAKTNGLPTQVYVTMLRLDIRNGAPLEDPITHEYIKCLSEDFAYGCTEYYGVSPTEFYPYGNINPVLVDVESVYLPNVLPREMDVVTNPPMPAALQAQALAARTIADWKYRANFVNYGYNYIDNSTNNQIFIPYSYKYYAPNDTVRELISDAITSTNGQYLSYNGESIDAEFSNDIDNPTGQGSWSDNLVSVQDPISVNPPCDLDPVGNGLGMSQKGAIRWAKGNQCAGSGDQPWPVTWADYRQILVHYYTGIDILNGSGNKVAPDDRWNLLWHEVPFNAETDPNIPIDFQIQVQNTSILDWGNNEVELGYQWTVKNAPAAPGSWTGTNIYVPAASKGEDKTFTASNIMSPSDGGDYTLHLDLRHNNGSWFSNGGWPDARIDISITGGTATPTATSTLTPTATQVITAYFHSPDGPNCVGSCGSQTGFNNVVTPVRNEQSLQAYDGGPGYVFGQGRVETKILVGGAGLATIRRKYSTTKGSRHETFKQSQSDAGNPSGHRVDIDHPPVFRHENGGGAKCGNEYFGER